MAEPKCGKSFPANAVRICVEEYGNYDISGKIYSRSFDRGLEYDNIADLLLKIDLLLDEQNRPQAFQEKRTFQKGARELLPEMTDTGEAAEEKDIFLRTGTYGTYDLMVQSRKHTSLQGFVRSGQGEFLGEFESELRLMEIVLRETRHTFASVGKSRKKGRQ